MHSAPSSMLMSARRPTSLLAALSLVLFLAGYVQAQVEVRVDDNDPAIVYEPAISWYRDENENPMDAGGFHMVTTDTAASATFRFTGTGISYMAPLWAEEITTQVRLDGGVPVLIDLQDKTVPAEVDGATTVESSVLWSERGLTNTEHVLVIDVAPGGRFAVVDMLVIEQDDSVATTDTTDTATETETGATPTTSTDTSTTSSRTRRPAATSPTASPTPQTRAGLTITIAVVCGVAGFLFILGLLLFLARRRRQRREREAWNKVDVPPTSGPSAPLMDEVDDGINAPPKQRFRSIPSRNSASLSKLYGDETPPDNVSQMTAPIPPAKAPSRLRQVVATEDNSNRQSWVPYEGPTSNQPPRT